MECIIGYIISSICFQKLFYLLVNHVFVHFLSLSSVFRFVHPSMHPSIRECISASPVCQYTRCQHCRMLSHCYFRRPFNLRFSFAKRNGTADREEMPEEIHNTGENLYGITPSKMLFCLVYVPPIDLKHWCDIIYHRNKTIKFPVLKPAFWLPT